MNRGKYESAIIELIRFESHDIITTSGDVGTGTGDETGEDEG